MEDPVVFEEGSGTSSRLHPLQRPKFRELLTYARPGDTVHISEMFRLVRGTGHILDVLDVLHRDQVALRIHDGAFSAMDLTARHPRTGGLLSTVKFMVQALAAAGELQRDLRRDLTYDGLRGAEAKGSKGGRRPAVATEKTEAVRTAYLEGRSIAALARDHGVSRSAIRTAVAEARATPCASAPSWRYTAGSSPTAGPSTALPAPRRSRHSARPTASTRTASAASTSNQRAPAHCAPRARDRTPGRTSRLPQDHPVAAFGLTLAGPRPGPRPSTSRRRRTRWTRRSSGRPNGRSWRRPQARRADAPDGNDAGYRGGNGRELCIIHPVAGRPAGLPGAPRPDRRR
ncbi:recombinase family protein [Streptomyces rimosus]|uniref:recombinase family protein n=1 Tax=Streptomyces rimosus TaxID=1927 RepID=UPI001F30F101|nr:recombinase family protein [Streptomyces rimosus]